jgi:hypothetical protein
MPNHFFSIAHFDFCDQEVADRSSRLDSGAVGFNSGRRVKT